MSGPIKSPSRKPRNFKHAAIMFIKSLKPWRVAIIIACILSAASTVLVIFGPQILGTITTTAVESLNNTGEIDWGPIKSAAITLIILYLFSAAVSYAEGYILAIVAARYTKYLRTKILEKIHHLPTSYFDRHEVGDVLSRITNDVEAVNNALAEDLTQIISSVTTVIGILVMMLSISFSLSLIALITVPISVFFIGCIMRYAKRYFRNMRERLGKLNARIEEDYTGQLIIKSNYHVPAAISDFKEVNNALYETSWKSQFFGALAFPLVHVFTNLSYVAICIIGGGMVIDGRLLIGNLQAFIQYVNQFNRPITEVSQISVNIQQILAAAERVFDFLEHTEEAPDPVPAATIPKFTGAVEFSHVNFAYHQNKPIIHDFSAVIKPGQQVAIVGPTGTGKTTLVNLLMRFYDPVSGEITIDGVKTTDMTRADVRRLFGMVLQDTWLFSGTVLDNLRYGNHDISLNDVKQAARQTGVHHFIESLPHGYHSRIDEDSDNISAGQKQLLTITRALIADPPMMILDEATSNVDTRTEQLIQEAFSKLTKGRTSFVIAHRLSTIKNSDLILVMNHGRLIESGTHDQLLRKKGYYAELYNSQFTDII